MKNYEKPILEVTDSRTEGVYAASGGNTADNTGTDTDKNSNSTEKKRCHFGRTEANPGADICQACSKSGGISQKLLEGSFREDYKGCIDNMPEKES
jgi:hypothetical protein